MSIIKSIFRIFIFIAGILLLSEIVLAQEDYQIPKPEYDWKKEVNKQETEHRKLLQDLNAEHRDAMSQLREQDTKLEAQLQNKRNQRLNIQKRINQREATISMLGVAQRIVGMILFPVQSFVALFSNKLVNIFFPITVLGLILWCHSRYSYVFKRKRVLATAGLILSLILFFLPLTVRAQDEESLQLLDTLEETNQLLSLSPVKLFIHVLESDSFDNVEIPEINSGNDALRIPRQVQRNTIQYDYALAGLKYADSRYGAAVDIILNIFDSLDEYSSKSPASEKEILLDSIRFLVERGKSTDAVIAIEKSGNKFPDIDYLFELMVFSKENELPESYSSIRDNLYSALVTSNSINIVLDYSEKYRELGENELAVQLLEEAVTKAKNTDDRIYLAQYYLKKNNTIRATGILEDIISQDRNIDTLERILKLAQNGKLVVTRSRALEALLQTVPVAHENYQNYIDLAINLEKSDLVLISITRIYSSDGFGDEYIELIDKFQRKGKSEYARIAYNLAIEEVQVTDKNRVQTVRQILDTTFDRKLYDISLTAILKLATYLDNYVSDYDLMPPDLVVDTSDLPSDDDDVNIQILFGALNQELGFNDKAEKEYKSAIEAKLSKINRNLAQNIRPDLNDFYFLQKYLVSTGDLNTLEKLEPIVKRMIDVYEKELRLETESVIYRMKVNQNDEIEGLKKVQSEEIRVLENKLTEKQKQLDKFPNLVAQDKQLLKKVRVENMLHGLRLLGMILVLGMVLTGIVYVAYIHSQRWKENRYFAFLSKSLEAYGFFCFITVINLVIGAGLVYLAQYSLIYQKKSDDDVYLGDIREKMKAV